MTTRTRNISGLKFWVRIIIQKDGSGYHAFSPALKGIHAGGDTPEEALFDAREAAGLILKCKIEDGDPIPLDVIEKPREEDLPVLQEIVKSSLEEIWVELK
jgi:predicted RNase H-like HicB family nuclease